MRREVRARKDAGVELTDESGSDPNTTAPNAPPLANTAPCWKPARLYPLLFCAVAAATLVTASKLPGWHAAMWSIPAAGFFNSIMFPTVFERFFANRGAPEIKLAFNARIESNAVDGSNLNSLKVAKYWNQSVLMSGRSAAW